MRVKGPAAWEMAVVFSEGWIHAGGEPFEIKPLHADVVEAPGSRILVLDSRPNRGQAESAAVLAAVAAAAKQRLWITNAYFAPGHRGVEALTARPPPEAWTCACCCPARRTCRIVRHAGHGYYRRLLKHGVRIFEYQPAPSSTPRPW